MMSRTDIRNAQGLPAEKSNTEVPGTEEYRILTRNFLRPVNSLLTRTTPKTVAPEAVSNPSPRGLITGISFMARAQLGTY